MEILSRAVGRRKEAVAQVQIVKGTGQFLINNIAADQYLQNNTCTMISVKSPLYALGSVANEISQPQSQIDYSRLDTIVKVKGGGLIGQAEAIKLGLARALCLLDKQLASNNNINNGTPETNENSNQPKIREIRKILKDKGYLTQDSRVKERRKYGLKKARKASQYHKR
uniref:Small ribosomal subunit protein uS9c n=1 Tax=Characiochloris acuminata TaxID=167768 RepID=A0A0S2LPJ6_9CHLO|nr:ribosomal protein S9 [Characiochloris acuminata]ALO63319.1 ribosomal protein S9 [Characiochloris acuminata]